MSRIVLIHWKASEIPERVAKLGRGGHSVEPFCGKGGAGLRGLGDNPPAAFVIDLTRLPSHGRAAGVFLRQQKATRQVPLLFVGGEYEKIAGVRKELPDAIYTDWPNVSGGLKRAFAWKNDKPVVPGTMAGYSGTPLPKKLGVTGDRTVALLHAPRGFEDQIRGPDGTPRIRRGDRSPSDVVIWFVKKQSELKDRLQVAKKAMAPGGGMWIAWPKKASGVKTDVTETLVRETGLANGLVDYKICAIDETWSGLKFAVRGAKR